MKKPNKKHQNAKSLSILENKWGPFKWIKNKEQPYKYHGDPRATFSQVFGTSNPFDLENSSTVLKRKVSPDLPKSSNVLQTFQKYVEIEKRNFDTTQKLIEISNQVQKIESTSYQKDDIQNIENDHLSKKPHRSSPERSRKTIQNLLRGLDENFNRSGFNPTR